MRKKQSLRGEVFAYAEKAYGAAPEYLWARFPQYGVLRHKDNGKWFGIVMDVPRAKLGLPGDGRADILNVKTDDPLLTDMLLHRKGFLPGYHFSRGSWISVLLDGTVPPEEICSLLDGSFQATAAAKKKQALRPPKAWLIPANPKYYDVIGAFAAAETVDWKQGAGVRTGDTVFMYVAAPVSAVLYECEVLQTDIPFRYADKNVKIGALMKLRLLRCFPPEAFPFAVLKEDFGVFAVRGPRGVPHSLLEAFRGYGMLN